MNSLARSNASKKHIEIAWARLHSVVIRPQFSLQGQLPGNTRNYDMLIESTTKCSHHSPNNM